MENNYDTLKDTTIAIEKYPDNSYFLLASDTDKEIDNSVIVGEVYYVDMSSETYHGPIDNDAMKEVLGLGGLLEIDVKNSHIDFKLDIDSYVDNELMIGGFYYSMDGKPKMKAYYSETSTKKDGKGWRVEENIGGGNWYYTEKIKGNFYFYEGTDHP